MPVFINIQSLVDLHGETHVFAICLRLRQDAWFLIIQQQISCLRIYKIIASLDRKKRLYVNLRVYMYVYI